MKDYLTLFLSRSIPIVLLGASALTTGLVYAKITSPRPQLSTITPQAVEVSVPETNDLAQAPDNTPSPSLTLMPSRTPSTPTRTLLTPTTTPLPTSVTTNTANRCLVTLYGNQYDVTSLRTTHSGGDIFKCGTDMTSIYQSQHGTGLSRMQPYLLGSTGQAINSPNSVSSGNDQTTSEAKDLRDKHDEDDD